MKKYLQFTVVIFVFFLLVYARQSLPSNGDTSPQLKPQQVLLSSAAPSTTIPASPSPTSTPTPTPKQTGRYRDGTYNGSTVDAYYGMMQVQVVVSGGNMTAVNILQYPSDNRTSQRINGQALPILQQEALQSQSANVDAVSGASASSPAFQQSLQSALSQAT